MRVIEAGYMDNGTGKHQSNTVINPIGLFPAITTLHGGTQQIKILEGKKMPKRLGNLQSDSYGTGYGYNVYDKKDISPIIKTFCGGGQQPHIIEERKDMNEESKMIRVGQISSDGSQYGTVLSEKGLSATLGAGTHGYCNNCIQQKYRIRKLTPRECFRLMNFDDEDFFAAESVNSNTRLYSQAGNSIVVNCLAAIFSQLNIKGVTPWNKMTLEEKYKFSKINVSDDPGYEKDLL